MNIVRNLEHRTRMQELEAAMLREFDQYELETKHHFAHGTYTRELHIPADMVITGKIHRHSCINIVTKGRLKVLTDEGEYEICAPHTFVSGPGVKKAAYTLEDTIWINVHPWDGEQNLELIEQAVIVPSYEALESEQRELIEEM